MSIKFEVLYIRVYIWKYVIFLAQWKHNITRLHGRLTECFPWVFWWGKWPCNIVNALKRVVRSRAIQLLLTTSTYHVDSCIYFIYVLCRQLYILYLRIMSTVVYTLSMYYVDSCIYFIYVLCRQLYILHLWLPAVWIMFHKHIYKHFWYCMHYILLNKMSFYTCIDYSMACFCKIFRVSFICFNLEKFPQNLEMIWTSYLRTSLKLFYYIKSAISYAMSVIGVPKSFRWGRLELWYFILLWYGNTFRMTALMGSEFTDHWMVLLIRGQECEAHVFRCC